MLTATTSFILTLLDRSVPLEATTSPSWFQLGRELQTGQLLSSRSSFSLLKSLLNRYQFEENKVPRFWV